MRRKKTFTPKTPNEDVLVSCPIGPGIWMMLPTGIKPEEKKKRVENYLQRANKSLPVYNPNA